LGSSSVLINGTHTNDDVFEQIGVSRHVERQKKALVEGLEMKPMRKKSAVQFRNEQWPMLMTETQHRNGENGTFNMLSIECRNFEMTKPTPTMLQLEARLVAAAVQRQ
jgi:hypothetical protein